MNVTDIIKQFVQALLIYLLQVLVFRTTALWNVAACFIYIGFIIQLPFYLPRLSLLAITFVYTFAIDIFFNTPGVHTSAALLIMYIRPSVVKLLSPQGGYDSFESVNIFNMGIQWHAMYALILIFIHTSAVFLIESLGAAHFGVTFLKIISTTLLTLIAVIMYQFLFLYKHTSR